MFCSTLCKAVHRPGVVKMQRLFSYLKKFRLYLRREKIDNPWNFNSICSTMRTLYILTGLITYESPFKEVDISNFKEIFTFFPLVTSATLTFLFAVTTIVMETSRDIYAGIKVLPVAIAGGSLVAQGVRKYLWKDDFQNFWRHLKYLWHSESSHSINDELSESLKKIHNAVKQSLSMTIIAGLFFLLRPVFGLIVYTLNGDYERFLETKVLPNLYPFRVDNVAKYILCNLLEAYGAIYCGICRCTIGVSFIVASGIISLKFQIVASTFRIIIRDSGSGETESDSLNQLHKIAREHNTVLSCCRMLHELYSPVVSATVIHTGLSLAISVIVVEKDLSEGNVFASASFFNYFTCSLIELTMYCHFAEMISHSATEISHAIYDCRWYNQSATFKKSLLIIMIAAQKGYKFKVFGLYEINKVLLTKVVMLAINSITVLRNVNSLRSY